MGGARLFPIVRYREFLELSRYQIQSFGRSSVSETIIFDGDPDEERMKGLHEPLTSSASPWMKFKVSTHKVDHISYWRHKLQLPQGKKSPNLIYENV